VKNKICAHFGNQIMVIQSVASPFMAIMAHKRGNMITEICAKVRKDNTIVVSLCIVRKE
jgi:hypothetical protein